MTALLNALLKRRQELSKEIAEWGRKPTFHETTDAERKAMADRMDERYAVWAEAVAR